MLPYRDRRPPLGIRNATPGRSARFRTVGTITYFGWAAMGSSESDAVWRVARMDKGSGLDLTWADGDDRYDNVWVNYASLTYV